jgi:hypothetical protein
MRSGKDEPRESSTGIRVKRTDRRQGRRGGRRTEKEEKKKEEN